MITPIEKALTLSYIHANSLIANLDVVIHEAKISGNPKAGQLNDKMIKLRSAAKNAFKAINKNLEEMGAIDDLTNDIDDLIDKSWDLKDKTDG